MPRGPQYASATGLGLDFLLSLFPSGGVVQGLPTAAGIAWNCQGTPCLCLPPAGNQNCMASTEGSVTSLWGLVCFPISFLRTPQPLKGHAGLRPRDNQVLQGLLGSS